MNDVQLLRGEHKRLWVLNIKDGSSGDQVQLPASDDWHACVRALNMLASMYGAHNVELYQWDIHHVETSVEEMPI